MTQLASKTPFTTISRICLLLTALLTGVITSHASDVTIDNINYTISDDQATVDGLADSTLTKTVTIPAEIECDEVSYPVTSIGDHAFYDCYSLTSITLPQTITTIESSAFYNCVKLKSFNIPNSVKSIGNRAFYGCTGLKSIAIPDSVATIGERAFEGCTGLTAVSLAESVISIGDRAFQWCAGLTEITIPKSVTMIGASAFVGCSGLKWIESQAIAPPTIATNTFSNYNIPLIAASQRYKTANVWKNFTNIANSYVPSGATFEVDGLNYKIISSKNLTCRLFAINDSVQGDVVIPDTVGYNNRVYTPIEISGILIKGKSPITSLSIPETITTIASSIMVNASLAKLNVNTSVTDNIALFTSIDELVIAPATNAFTNSLELNSVGKLTIEDSDTTLTTMQFKCSGLNEIYLGRNVSENTFADVATLKTATISDNVTSIENSVLSQLTIPSSVNNIGTAAFQGCTGVKQLFFEEGDTELFVDTSAFDSVAPTEIAYGRQMDFTTVPHANLNEITLGGNITTIAEGAFGDAPALRIVKAYPTIPPTIAENTFADDTYSNGTLYVAEDAYDSYKEAIGWGNFLNIEADNVTTGLANVADDTEFAATSIENSAICVDGNAQVGIYTMNGSLIYSGDGECRVDVAPGLYIVKIGNTARKVAVK
jgi:hypothetical protein